MKNIYWLFFRKQKLQLSCNLKLKQVIIICISITFLTINKTSDCLGKLNDKYKDGSVCVGGVSGVAIGLAAVPEPIVTKGAAAVAGAFQVGWFATGFIWNLFDPPDTINACIPVNLSSYLIYTYPDIFTIAPMCDPILGSYLNVCTDYADTLVALSRAILASNDRYQGALLIGNLNCAIARRNELNNFIGKFNQLRPFLKSCWVPVLNRINVLNPSLLNTPLSKSRMIAMRDTIGAGNYPQDELIAINAWQLTPSELSILTSFIQSIPNSMIDVFYDEYSPGSNDIPFGACLNQALECAVDFEIQPVTSSSIYNYNAQVSGTANILYTTSAVSDLIGWAAGANATVRRTTNGVSWTNASGTGITGNIYNINALDANTAFCTTTPSSSFIYKTTNGGTTWVTVFTQSGGFINGIQMVSSTEGYALGDPVGGKWTVLKTTNSGNTWIRMTTEPNQVGAEAGWNNSFKIIGSHMWFGTNSNRVYHSTNLGLTWTSTSTASVGNIFAIHFNSLKNGIAGGDAMVYSYDSAVTFSQVTTPGTLTEIYGLEGFGMDWWAVGNGASIYKSADNGLNWTSVDTQPGVTFNAIDFANVNNSVSGWIVGSTGRIVKMSSTKLEATLGLTAFMEGFFDSGSNTQIGDTVNAYLRNITSPYALVDSAKGYLNANGNATLNFAHAAAGNYYLVIKHRNSIETWSASGQSFTPGSTTNYNFTTFSSQSYGSNLVLYGTKWCIYAGDVDQNGSVDLSDVVSVFNSANAFATGYVVTDVNGNGIVDLSDIILTYNNAGNFVAVMKP